MGRPVLALVGCGRGVRRCHGRDVGRGRHGLRARPNRMATAVPRRRSRRNPLRTNQIRARTVVRGAEPGPKSAAMPPRRSTRPSGGQRRSHQGRRGRGRQPPRNRRRVERPRRSGASATRRKLINNVIAAVTHQPDRKVVIDRTRQTEPVETPDPVETVDAVEHRVGRTSSNSTATRRDRPAERRRCARHVRADAVEPHAGHADARATEGHGRRVHHRYDVPPVISAIGTAVFGLISFAESVFEGPPKALPGSGVTVKRSTLDLGDVRRFLRTGTSRTPTTRTATPPERIIYLQHGFLARGVFYDYTASYLAKETNSIVVAPDADIEPLRHRRHVAGRRPDAPRGRRPFPRRQRRPAEERAGRGLQTGRIAAAGRPGRTFARRRAGAEHRALHGGRRDGDRSTTVGRGADARRRLVQRDPARLRHSQRSPTTSRSTTCRATPYLWNLFGTMDAALAQERPDRVPRRAAARRLALGRHGGRQPADPARRLPAHRLRADRQCRGDLRCWPRAGSTTCSPARDLHRRPAASTATRATFTIPTTFGPAIGLVQPAPGVRLARPSELTRGLLRAAGSHQFATDVPQTEQTSDSMEIIRTKYARYLLTEGL